MKLLSYELSDWTDIPTSSMQYCNYYRRHRKMGPYFSIGLIIKTSDVPLEGRRWRFDTCGLRDNRLIEFFHKQFKDTD